MSKPKAAAAAKQDAETTPPARPAETADPSPAPAAAAFTIGQKVRITTSKREGVVAGIYAGGWYNVAINDRGNTIDVQGKNLEDAAAPPREQVEAQQRDAAAAARAQRAAAQAKILDDMAAPAIEHLAKARDAELAALEEKLEDDDVDAQDLVARQQRQLITARYEDGVKAERERVAASDEYQARIAAT